MRSTSLLCLSFILIVSLGSPTTFSANSFPQSQEYETPVYPTGAVASFPDAVADPSAIKSIYIGRYEDADTRVWVVKPQEVIFMDPGRGVKGSSFRKGVGFVVPQLPKGTYIAWYERTESGRKSQYLKLIIRPELLADSGIVRGHPGEDLQVKIRIGSTTLYRRYSNIPDRIRVPVTLKSKDSTIANFVPDQIATVSTDSEGYAVWKLRINSPGIAEFTATADNFEPAKVMVVGMRAPGRTFLEGEFVAAQQLLTEQASAAREAVAKAGAVEKFTTVLETQAKKESAEARSPEDTARVAEMRSSVTRMKDTLEKAQANAKQAEVEVANAQAVLATLRAQWQALEPGPISESEMKPGDILLVLGSTPVISELIRGFEALQLGPPAHYSHASIYLGKNHHGIGLVAEMWRSGYWITPLAVSTKGAIIVDVFRRGDIDDSKRSEIAVRAANLFGPWTNYITQVEPPRGSRIPYAMEQIGVLAGAAAKFPSFIVAEGVRRLADPRAGGRRKMICSELVAWVYCDVGLDLAVTHWGSLATVLTSEERRKDYTTPNMIAKSRHVQLAGRYLGP